MANVDLIKDAYRNYLGRDASDAEVQGWESGAYGGGGVNDWVNQIANSGEAKARQPQQQAPVINQPSPDTSHTYEQPSTPGGPGADYSGALSSAYQQYLGRQANPDEIQNWWSGSYGHGQGWNNFNQVREAIRTSGEAKARNNGSAPTPYYQDTSYWQGQGVKESDMFDLATGQMKPGWSRTAKGYERTGATGGSSVAPPGGNFQTWFQSLTGGKAPTPQSLKAMEPLLNQYGIKLGPINGRGFTDGIILPDGTFVDVIMGATENGGTGWGWITGGHGVGGGPAPGNQFSDPYTQFLEQLIKSRIGNLQGGYDSSARDQYGNALQQRANALGQGNKQLDQLLGYLQERFTDLKGPGYTGAEQEVLRTGALDPMERDRSAARQRLTERLAARGINQESGIFQQAMQELDTEFDGMRAITQTQLSTNELGRRENRNQRAEMIGAQIADIPDQRAREQLDVFQALENLSMLARNEDEARSREAINYGGVLADLGPQRMQLAMQAAGMGGNPSGLGSMLTQIAGLNQTGQAYNAQNSQSLWSGLGSLAAIIARSGQSGLSGVRV
jgi:hypothetical protein